jgi:hypothetical protein
VSDFDPQVCKQRVSDPRACAWTGNIELVRCLVAEVPTLTRVAHACEQWMAEKDAGDVTLGMTFAPRLLEAMRSLAGQLSIVCPYVRAEDRRAVC